MKTYRLREDRSLEETTGNIRAMTAAFRVDRHVGKTKWGLANDSTLVLSTVFLVIDHDGDLFETMVHIEDGSFGEGQVRYPSWEKAKVGHAALAEAISKVVVALMTPGDALAAADRVLESG